MKCLLFVLGFGRAVDLRSTLQQETRQSKSGVGVQGGLKCKTWLADPCRGYIICAMTASSRPAMARMALAMDHDDDPAYSA